MPNGIFFLQTAVTRSIVIGIAAGIILFLLLSAIIIAFVFEYIKKKRSHVKELIDTKNIFEKQLLESKLEIQEQTFNSISQEIHDNVGQMLTLAKVQLSVIEQNEFFDKAQIREVKDTVGQAMNDLRDIAKSLSTQRLQYLSLPESVEYQVQRINRSGLLHVSLCQKGNEQIINDNAKLLLFRIIQESLQNIVKHAKASAAQITFDFQVNQLELEVYDNGIGFDNIEKSKKYEGLGLNNIVERVKLLKGTVFINSASDKGTSIKINIPYA